MNREILKESGIDYAAGIQRFLEDEALYEEMLTVFLKDDSFSKAREAFDAENYHELFEWAHTLKGVSGNLDMYELYRAADELTEFLRNNGEPEAETAAVLFGRMESAYQRVVGGIRAALNVPR